MLCGLSPRVWGWSGDGAGGAGAGEVVPTRVGMVRHRAVDGIIRQCCPHACGDGPPMWVLPGA